MAATILLTGATGLIGFRILLAALEAGHHVRFTARSDAKAQTVTGNPAVQKLLAASGSVTAVIITDFTADGAFDAVLTPDSGITHIIHAGSPVPVTETSLFGPTLKITESLLTAALQVPTIKRVVITSSIVGNLGLVPPPTPVTAATRPALPDPVPATFDVVFHGYVWGKVGELHATDAFIQKHNPPFGVNHVAPGYVYGRNELARDAAMMRDNNSSNNVLLCGMTGGTFWFPVHGGFGHVDDVADAHLRVAFLAPEAVGHKDFAVTTKVNYDTFFDPIEKAFPKAVAAGVLKRGVIPTLPMEYDSEDIETVLGRKLKSFDTAVVDVAAQYLETLGVEKA